VSDRPYSQTVSQDGGILRVFRAADLTETELKWHRDARDRDVLFVSGCGWRLQVEGGLPTAVRPMTRVYIPRDMWHRLICEGKDDLTVLIREK
jgi:hypothetical protein